MCKRHALLVVEALWRSPRFWSSGCNQSSRAPHLINSLCSLSLSLRTRSKGFITSSHAYTRLQEDPDSMPLFSRRKGDEGGASPVHSSSDTPLKDGKGVDATDMEIDLLSGAELT